MSISVIIPVKNSSGDLGRCLNAFTKQTIIPTEIIVVNNTPKNKLIKKIVSEYKSKLPILDFDENKIGRAGARNKGIRKSTCDIVAFIDVDCVPAPNWISEIKESLSASDENILQGDWTDYVSDKSLSSLLFYYYRRKLSLLYKRNNYVSFIDTKNIAFRKWVFTKYKLFFNEDFQYGEDIELGIRILNKKLKIIFNPNMTVNHFIKRNYLNYISDRFYQGLKYALIINRMSKIRYKYLTSSNLLFEWNLLRTSYVKKISKSVRRKIENKMDKKIVLVFRLGLAFGDIIWKAGYFYGKFIIAK